jgi:hypothetical protein
MGIFDIFVDALINYKLMDDMIYLILNIIYRLYSFDFEKEVEALVRESALI